MLLQLNLTLCLVCVHWLAFTVAHDVKFPEHGPETLPASCAQLQDSPNDKPDFERIIGMIRAMRADDLLRNAGPRLEIILGERESTCTNKAGYAMMRNFFQKHPIANFKVLHKGGGGSAYLMGIYRDKYGQVFKVRVFFGFNAGRWEIARLIFR